MITMGLFTKKTPEEKEQRKQEKQQKQEASAIFTGNPLQPIGKITINDVCGLTLKPVERALNIHHDKTNITLPYERLKGFRVEDETTLAKSASGLGGAIVGGALFGTAGAIVGQNAKKGKTKTKWIATLTYEDKEGNLQELRFIERGITGIYEGENKSFSSLNFEQIINRIASENSEDITEL